MSYPTKTQTNTPINDPLLTLYVTIDELVQQVSLRTASGRGRPCKLSDTELVTIVIWSMGLVGTKTWRGCYNLIANSHAKDFPNLPTYAGFVEALHRIFPLLVTILEQLLPAQTEEYLRLIDATKLPVCKNVRIDSHKVAKGIAKRGKTSQGWFYGFKLHLGVSGTGTLRSAYFTSGNVHDGKLTQKLLKNFQGIGVGDAGYLLKESSRQAFFRTQKIWLLTGVRKNMGKLMTKDEQRLLKVRQRVEGVFDYLKEHLSLVTSFARSVTGYFLHYVAVLLTYQVKQIYGII